MTLSEPDRVFVEQARSRAQRTSRTIFVLALAVALLALAGAMLGYGYASERSRRTSAIEALQRTQREHDVELEDVKRRQTLLLQQLEANHITPDPEALLPAPAITATIPPSGKGKSSSPATTVTTAARTPSTTTTTTAPPPATTTTTAPPPSPTTTSQICGALGTVGPCAKGGP